MNASAERIIPDDHDPRDALADEILRSHIERYEFAAMNAMPGRVLDIACGVGYGTWVLVDSNDKILSAVGVDNSPEAIAYAKGRYDCSRIEYKLHDAMTYTDDKGFDTIVSLETIEHMAEPARFLANISSLLNPGGVIICSAPITPSRDGNPFHLTDFTEESILQLFAEHGFHPTTRLVQRYPIRWLAGIKSSDKRSNQFKGAILSFYENNPMYILKRLGSTLKHGLNNIYLIAVFERC